MPMKKITFNAPLNHKAYSYEPMQIEVEKVIFLYGKRFEQMRDHPLDDCPEIIENRDLMYMEGNTAHCMSCASTRCVKSMASLTVRMLSGIRRSKEKP